jgi:hypothetical protein
MFARPSKAAVAAAISDLLAFRDDHGEQVVMLEHKMNFLCAPGRESPGRGIVKRILKILFIVLLWT